MLPLIPCNAPLEPRWGLPELLFVYMFLRVTQNARDNPDSVFWSLSSSVASPALFISTTSDISSQLAERIKLPLPASPPSPPPACARDNSRICSIIRRAINPHITLRSPIRRSISIGFIFGILIHFLSVCKDYVLTLLTTRVSGRNIER